MLKKKDEEKIGDQKRDETFKLRNKLKTIETQPCPVCNKPIGLVAGSKEAICPNCGFKDPCCE